MKPPRQNRLSWSDHHILIALITADRSPDPNTQVGACCIDKRNRIVGTGYNGAPRGIKPELIDWSREADDPCDTKYPFVVHAEKNSVQNAPGGVGSLEGCTTFSVMYPCENCAKDLLQAGIKKVVYLENPYENTPGVRAAKRMFELAEVEVVQHKWDNPDVVQNLLDRLKQRVK